MKLTERERFIKQLDGYQQLLQEIRSLSEEDPDLVVEMYLGCEIPKDMLEKFNAIARKIFNTDIDIGEEIGDIYEVNTENRLH